MSPLEQPQLALAESLAPEVLRFLTARGETLALAESCTGGLAAALITALPGASKVFLEGLIVYQNEAKLRRLNLRPETLAAHGAVSAECVRELAENLSAQSGATYALAVSGIAGPDGATPGKPVGTVFFALCGPHHTQIRRENFPGSRREVQAAAVATLYSMLLNHPTP